MFILCTNKLTDNIFPLISPYNPVNPTAPSLGKIWQYFLSHDRSIPESQLRIISSDLDNLWGVSANFLLETPRRVNCNKIVFIYSVWLQDDEITTYWTVFFITYHHPKSTSSNSEQEVANALRPVEERPRDFHMSIDWM